MEEQFKEELRAEVYTIGYKTMGEGIVVKIISDNTTRFCAVIDCFEENTRNITLELIKNEHIDLICMTHPDEDHCKGLDKILKLADSHTFILYPSNVLYKKYSNESANKVIKKIEKYLAMNGNNRNKPKLKICIGNQIILKNDYIDIKNGGIYEFKIETYTPLTQIVEKPKAKELLGLRHSEIENNDFSIIMSMGIGTLKLLFCGDVENKTLIELDSEIDKGKKSFFYDVIDYVKISHHGSPGSDKMFSILSNVNKISNSVSTTYKNSNLPDKEMLKKYKRKQGNVYCTSNIDIDIQSEIYGIVKHSFDIIRQNVKTELIANAVEVNF